MKSTLKILFLWLLALQCVSGEEVGVVYPDLREPYAEVIREMLRGIRDGLDARTANLKIGKKTSERNIQQWVNSKNITTLVSLGNASESLTNSISINRVIGATKSGPNSSINYDGMVSMLPAPESVFEKAERLFKGVAQMHVIYREGDEWYIDMIRTAAEKRNVKIFMHMVSGMDDMNRKLNLIDRENSKGAKGAWIISSGLNITNDRKSMQFVNGCLDKNIFLISNQAADVYSGVLMATLPDPYETGVQLGEMAKKVNGDRAAKRFETSATVNTVVNTDTALGLNIRFSRLQRKMIDIEVP